MSEIGSTLQPCTVCRHEFTSIHAEAEPGVTIYVCETCLEAARDNFIFLCMHCGKTHVIHKMALIRNTSDPELRRAYIECIDEMVIQGISRCVSCDPAGFLEYMHPAAREC